MDISKLEIGTTFTTNEMLDALEVVGIDEYNHADIISRVDAFAYDNGYKLVDGGSKDVYVKVRK